jgi:hypothetical protein
VGALLRPGVGANTLTVTFETAVDEYGRYMACAGGAAKSERRCHSIHGHSTLPLAVHFLGIYALITLQAC